MHALWNGRTTHPAELVGMEPEAEQEEELLTPLEKRLEWICHEWKSAQQSDTYEEWHDVKMMIYGAQQTMVRCIDRYQDSEFLRVLDRIAFENSLDCIARGKYEGASK